ncbi:precorrin-6y C5,15-methyltransferase (decarboxylating) subunit CbiE [Propionicicella superfundia]|uniref:precorrin-6y C5,15-methyltransferase (decarboxylating) subunit CbiE n=1 Tax=Propionicicella superfundia TaxID=348582 RepID=UPI000427AFC0|nr:precorrin-6y C5,15-methyltransferase (decarboxylating) subunit CbiE [Propionicicella superfundia]
MITVHGLLGVPGDGLRAAVSHADRVVAGSRQLDALDVPAARRIRLGAPRLAAELVADLPPEADVVVIASGDPLFFGVVRALRLHGLRPRVIPAPSSIATAFAAVGLPWDDAVVVSAHGRPLATAANLARAHPKVAVLTSADNGLRELAAALAGQDRWYVLAERLGEPEERVRVLDGTAAATTEPSEPNVVLVLAARPDEPDAAWAGVIAGPDRAPRPQVSAAAAVAFARLLPEPGELVWATGELGADVAALAAWAGAAIDRDATIPRRAAAPVADVVVAGTADVLDGVSPRAAVLTGRVPEPLPAGYHWTGESVAGLLLTTGVRA